MDTVKVISKYKAKGPFCHMMVEGFFFVSKKDRKSHSLRLIQKGNYDTIKDVVVSNKVVI